MIGTPRMSNFRAAIEHAVVNQVCGDIVECGVWRGGACILARGVLNAMAADLKFEEQYFVGDRCVFVVDSFQGLPPPDTSLYPADAGDTYHTVDRLRVSQRVVRANFVRFDLLENLSGSDVSEEAARDRARGVVFLPGFFKESLTESRILAAGLRNVAVLRLDADMYGSTTQIFEALYDRVSRGGIVIVDDYSGESCRKAVHDFRDRRGITSPLQPIDWTGRWWIKD